MPVIHLKQATKTPETETGNARKVAAEMRRPLQILESRGPSPDVSNLVMKVLMPVRLSLHDRVPNRRRTTAPSTAANTRCIAGMVSNSAAPTTVAATCVPALPKLCEPAV